MTTSKLLNHLILVFLGSGLGGSLRYGLNVLFPPINFPIATLISNALAAFILGLLLGLAESKLISNELKFLLATGFCGGLSTFSTFSSETVQLFELGNISLSILNILLNLIISLLMVSSAIWIIRYIYP